MCQRSESSTWGIANGTAARVAVLAANRDDGTFGVTLVVVLTEPGDAELQGILASLDGDSST